MPALRSALIAALIFAALPAVGADIRKSEEEVCAEAVAYVSRVGKAERKRREQEAKEEALTNLARRAWSVGTGREYETRSVRVSGDSQGRGGITENQTIFESLRIKYRVNEMLYGGTYRIEGDREQKKIIYCVPYSKFEEAKRQLRQQRAQTVLVYRGRFADLERAIDGRQMDDAAVMLSTLKVEVPNEALEQETYESVLRPGRVQSFYTWLIEWDSRVDKGSTYARFLIVKAREKIDEGHLQQAGKYVSEALEADRQSVRARQLRDLIDERRREREFVLFEAENLAKSGKYKAARKKLAEARRLDQDDEYSLEITANAVQGLHAEYLSYNKRLAVGFSVSYGSLGADSSNIEQRIIAFTGIPVDVSEPLNFGVAADFRLGRLWQVQFGGSYGVATDENAATGQREDVYTLYQLTAAFGLRTVRKAHRRIGYHVSLGTALESVDTSVPAPVGVETADSEVGLYLRAAVETSISAFYVQHGFNFKNDNSGPSLVGWSDTWQIGVAFLF